MAADHEESGLGRTPARGRRTVGLLIGIALAFAAGEGFARLVVPAPHPPDGLIASSRAPTEPWGLQPGFRGRLKEKEFDVDVRVNKAGLRGPEISDKTSRPRVLFLGDSFAFGWGVDEDATFINIAAQDLSASGLPIEPINAGVPGYGPIQEVQKLRSICSQLRPDRVVLAFFAGNDLMDLLLKGTPGFGTPQWRSELMALRNDVQPAPSPFDFLKHNSALAQIAIFTSSRACTKVGLCPFNADPFRPRSVSQAELPDSLNVLIGALSALKRSADDCHVPLAIMIIPTIGQVQHADNLGTRLDELQAIEGSVQTWGENNKVPTMDLSGTFAEIYKRAPDQPLYFQFDLHLNRTGHAEAGHALAHFLAGQVLPRSGPLGTSIR